MKDNCKINCCKIWIFDLSTEAERMAWARIVDLALKVLYFRKKNLDFMQHLYLHPKSIAGVYMTRLLCTILLNIMGSCH
jgi:hypothetical protein